MYECRCDCGTFRIYEETNLRMPTRQSCGCYHRELMSKEPGYATYSRQYRNYAAAAKRRGREFALTLEQFKRLTTQHCHYCGDSPPLCAVSKTYSSVEAKQRSVVQMNGIDRRDNSIGYVPSNCLPCCSYCNWMKGEMSYEDFVRQCRKIHDKMWGWQPS